MKKLFFIFNFSLFVALAAVAADTPSRVIPSAASAQQAASQQSTDVNQQSAVGNQQSITQQSGVASRDTTTAENSQTISRAATATVVNRAAAIAPVVPAATPARTAATAAMATTASRGAAVPTSRENINDAAAQRGASVRVAASSANASAPVRRAGITLRPTTAEVGGRATILGTDIQTGSNVNANRAATVRPIAARAGTIGVQLPSVATTTKQDVDMDATNACIDQYTDCMDQFCAVIDANQKRCACSGNLATYSKSEQAVKDANTQLNDVAQNIRYVGLSADEISSIMKATEAEDALKNNRDTTDSRNMLTDIEKMIRDPSAVTQDGTGSNLLEFNVDFDSSGNFSDMFGLDTSNQSFANLRGRDLFSLAQKRCKTVLDSCKTKGADTAIVTGRYDIAIDQDCIAYEAGLAKMNQTLRSNVRSATTMLQQARLAVRQNQNSLDAKGCVGALETCMTDDMVCGSDFTKCLDPTKQYIDENGEVVLGQNITQIRKMMEKFNSSLIDANFIAAAVGMGNFTDCTGTNNNGKCIVKYLMTKIGTDDNKTRGNQGLCRPVLDKCQDYTRDASGNYDPKNIIVVNFIQRAMTNVRSFQEQIISDYASTCMANIATCYSKQVTQINAWSGNANVDNVYRVMQGACRNVALTCAYAVFAADNQACPVSAGDNTQNQNICIQNISDIFSQSMLCPDNSTWVPNQLGTPGAVYNSSPLQFYVNQRCVCDQGYLISAGQCVLPWQSCESGKSLTVTGCTDCGVESVGNGQACVQKLPTCDNGAPAVNCSCAPQNISMGYCCGTGTVYNGTSCVTPTSVSLSSQQYMPANSTTPATCPTGCTCLDTTVMAPSNTDQNNFCEEIGIITG